MSGGFQFASPAAAVEAILQAVDAVSSERIELGDAVGRILAEDVRTDRASPPLSVSAMDGFAVDVDSVRNADGLLIVEGDSAIGQAPRIMRAGTALRIVTGAPIPRGADAVVKVEDTSTGGGGVRVCRPAIDALRPGQHIRQQGENSAAGEVVVPSGCVIHAGQMAALSAFGVSRPLVRRQARAAIIVTGDELVDVGDTPQPWQIRDSNSWTVRAMLASRAWIQISRVHRAPDDPTALKRLLADAIDHADVVFLTGGVSMGHRDFVAPAVVEIGGRVLFHKIPQRPGKPILCAVCERVGGKRLIMALPGNPVSVMVTARRFGIPALERMGGMATPSGAPPATARDAGEQTIDLWWHRLARRVNASTDVVILPSRGSGDVFGAGGADGFVEVPPHQQGQGPWPFYSW